MTARKVLPVQDWPPQDRVAWATATADGDIFDGRGPAAHWSEGSRRSIASGYGRWIGHLAAQEPEALTLPPADRMTPARVEGFIEMLRGTVTPAGVHNYVKHSYDAIRVMAAERDWSWLRETARRLHRLVVPRDKRPRMVDADHLWTLGLDLMHDANADEALGSLERAIRFRDGLMIALLIARPVRRRNLTGIRLGHNLKLVGDCYLLVYRSEETKNRQALDFPLPDVLAPMIERYLTVHRPCFPGADSHDGLWASAKGGPLRPEAIYQRILQRTCAAFGHPINPHLFRDIAATTVAIEDPAHVGVAKDLLGHGRSSTTERHYNQANSLEAARTRQRGILALRHKLAQTARRSRRRADRRAAPGSDR